VRRILPALLLLALSVASGKEPPREMSHADRRRAAAIDQGLAYLESVQKKDGSFGSGGPGVVGITSLSLLAFLAAGHQENRGPYGDVLFRGVNYLLQHSLPPGRDPRYSDAAFGKPAGYIYVFGDHDSRMHGHGYATQVLVLAYGSGQNTDPRTRELRTKIQRAIRVIEEAQTFTGGWGYEPNHATFHEGSVTVTVVQALRLARDAGFVVDREVHARGLKYLKDSQKDDGSFKYALTHDRSTAALTAAAITAMHGFGEYYSEPIRRGLEYLRRQYEHRVADQIEWTFYANYYAAQAFWRAGGDDWALWTTQHVPAILDWQTQASEGRGFWDDQMLSTSPVNRGRAYATAYACLTLSVPDGYLPLFQR
jgi:hypothetical protein